MSLDAYRQTQARSATPRSTEYRLMSQVTGELIEAKEKGLRGGELMGALHHNREVWGTFRVLCSSPANQLPTELRASIISLAMWVDRYTTDVIRERDSIEALITVNRAVMEGLATENHA
jgi:flagellar biosynthesis activator protein FlaF